MSMRERTASIAQPCARHEPQALRQRAQTVRLRAFTKPSRNSRYLHREQLFRINWDDVL